jgi:signal transduction histidine kinase
MAQNAGQISSITLRYDYDLVAARRKARQIASILGFDEQAQTQLATVASEIARNALRYGRGGRFDFLVESLDGRDALVMVVTDQGAGIPNLEEILGGRYASSTGMGLGILGARKLMDDFAITTTAGRGTVVRMKKRLRPDAEPIDSDRIRQIVEEIARQQPENPIEEIQQQNADLLRALSELNEKQAEMEGLNRELEDTNRGVLALYAELDEKAESLRRADQLKTHFLADMSHEFRTPVNAILALTRLLEEGHMGGDSRKQVTLIRRAAEDLESLVNDLLDLAKIEAGKVDVRPSELRIETLFSTLRGMLRPLLMSRSLALVFEDVEELPVMFTDEGKLAQILRNFISNALKYTPAGEIRVSAEVRPGDKIRFSVTDTGIGIAPEDHERIFQEFTQVENALQRKHKGTGLGLPLTRKLAALIGGTVGVTSELGVGSTFFAEVPIRYTPPPELRPAAAMVAPEPIPIPTVPNLTRILIIDDDETARYTLATFASRPGVQLFEAENGMQGLERALEERPDMILLDLMMPGIGGHEVLQRLKQDRATAAIPVVIVTSRFVNDAEREQILSRAASVVYKGDLSREVVTQAIDKALGR